MRNRLIKTLAGVATLAALAFGGATLASAGSKAPPAKPALAAAKPAAAPSQPKESTAADTDNVQQGDQTAPDTGAAEESSGEAPESDADGAAQAAACKAAGITADNVQYDDQAGTCSLDTGADSGN